MKKIAFMTVVLSLLLCGAVMADQLVIVNKGVSVDSMDAKTLQKIYMGKKTKWDNGDKIVPITLNEGSVHDDFLKNIVKKSSTQFLTYWKQMIFTGKGIPPKSVPSDADVVSFVSGTAGAIGYIDSATPHNAVSVVTVN
jgi:ABC-type phosphate transport system substrate-binding protein